MTFCDQLSEVRWVAEIVLLTSTLYLVCWYFWNKRPRDSPPGFNGLPLIGVLPYLGRYPERSMERWNKKYGDVCMVKIGMADVVILGSVEAAREVFAKLNKFADGHRKDFVSLSGGYGILMINSGDFHHEQWCRFGVNTLRLLGMGQTSLAPRLVEISNKTCKKIDALCGADGNSRPFNIKFLVCESVSHIISRVFFGHEVVEKDEDFRQILQKSMEPNTFELLSGLVLFAPFLRSLPLYKMLSRQKEVLRTKVEQYIVKELTEHVVTWQQGESRDFIDHFLIKKTMCQQEDGQTFEGNKDNDSESDDSDEKKRTLTSDSPFSFKHFARMCRDVILATVDTSAMSISWTLLYLSQHRDIQIKLQTEIDKEFVAYEGPPPFDIRKLPYMRAVLQEVERLRPVAPLGVENVSSYLDSKSKYLLHHYIPEDAILFPNIWAIHHDRNIWKEPEMFKPERHLDSEGRFVNSTNIVQFNIGTRSCLEQELAKNQLFVVIVSLLRRFTFELSEGQKVNIRRTSFIKCRPPIYKVVATRR